MSSSLATAVDSDVSTAPTSTSSTPLDLCIWLSKYGLTERALLNIKDEFISLAKEAGQMMLAADPCVGTSDTKNNSSDRVTETDRSIENMVKNRLAEAYPEITFLGEETFKQGDKLSENPTFVCDRKCSCSYKMNSRHAY